MQQVDLEVLLYLNHTAEAHPDLLRLIKLLADSPLARGLPSFGTLIYLWFSSDNIERRCSIVVGMLATSAALAVSVLLQFVLTVHLRPIFDPAVDVANLLRWEKIGFGKRVYSFPSDTSVLYFGFAAVIFTVNKAAGVANFVWCLVTVGLLRVALGLHYPSDILAAIFLTSLSVFAASRVGFLRATIARVMKSFDARQVMANAAFVMFLLEAYNLFQGVQALLAVSLHLVMGV